MDKGTCFTFNGLAFPRYHYYQYRLKSLIPRWQRILEAGGLSNCVSEGTSRLKEISRTADHLTELSTIYLFADEKFLRTNDLQLSVECDSSVVGEVGVQSVTWSSCKHLLRGLVFFQPTVIVIAQAAFDNKVAGHLSDLNDDQLGSIIIYNIETKKNVLYTDLANAGFRISDVDVGGDKAVRHAGLSAQIQHILEGKVVGILELITDYNHPFVPKPSQELDEDIPGIVNTALYDALYNEYIVTDIEPAKTGTDTERNDSFQKNLSEFLNKKSRCVTCSNISKKFGIPEHIVNELLNDGFFGFETRFTTHMEKLTLPTYPTDKTLRDICRVCQDFVHPFIKVMKVVFVEFEEYIKAKQNVLYVMLKLQFELFGMLRLANVEVRVAIPPLTVLPAGLQEELLKDDVEGCGTFYGELWLHFSQQPSPGKMAHIRDILKEYKYHGEVKWELTPCRVEQALGLLIEPGQTLRAHPPNGPNPMYGSLGCFVQVSPKDLNIGMSIASAKPGTKVAEAGYVQSSSVHAITCAHCVKDCDVIEVQKGDDGAEFVRLGQKRLELYFQDSLDVATIVIEDVNTCASNLKRFDERCTNMWTSFSGNPCGLQVQKAGSRTKFTKGIVTSSDYVSQVMQAHDLQRLKCNVCIESLPDLPEGASILAQNAPLQLAGVQFSREGDSGSVVCADNPNDNSVFIVSLLIGAVVKRAGGEEAGCSTGSDFKFSYSSKFENTLEEIKSKYDVNIERAVLNGPPPAPRP